MLYPSVLGCVCACERSGCCITLSCHYFRLPCDSFVCAFLHGVRRWVHGAHEHCWTGLCIALAFGLGLFFPLRDGDADASYFVKGKGRWRCAEASGTEYTDIPLSVCCLDE
jgi:hypothetical protein